MTSSIQAAIFSAIGDAFQAFGQAPGQSATDVAVNLLGGTEADRKAIESVASTFDTLNERHAALHAARLQGGTREGWLGSELLKVAASSVGLPAALAEGLSRANQELSEGAAPKVEHFKASAVDSFNAGSLSGELCRALQDNVGLNVPQFEAVESLIPEAVKDVPFAKAYLEAAIGDARDKDANILATAAMLKVRHSGLFDAVPAIKDLTLDELAIMVDRGLTTAKLAYKLTTGQLGLGDVTDFLVDRSVAALSVLVTKALAAGGATIGMTIGATLCSVFGPAGTAFGATVGRALGNLAGYAAAQRVKQGIRDVSVKAKLLAREGVRRVKTAASRMVAALFC